MIDLGEGLGENDIISMLNKVSVKYDQVIKVVWSPNVYVPFACVLFELWADSLFIEHE